METNITIYKEFYEKHNQEIENAYNCAYAKPYSNMSNILENIKIYLKDISSIPTNKWNDLIREKFDNCINILITNIEKIYNSVNSNWKSSDELYKQMHDGLRNLKVNIDDFDTLLKQKPIQSNYRSIDPISGVISYPGYNSAISKWNGACQEKDNNCQRDIEKLKALLNNLSEINQIDIKLNNMISFNNRSLTIKDNYLFKQYASSWANKKFSQGNFKNSGCSITAAATAISIGLNEVVTPIDANNRRSNIGVSTVDKPNMINAVVNSYNLEAKTVNISENDKVKNMLNDLSDGNVTVIARIAPNNGRFRSKNGHYINLINYRVNKDGSTEVLVSDPGSSKTSRNGWVPYNDIKKSIRADNSFTVVY